jgi:hypothetical protein
VVADFIADLAEIVQSGIPRPLQNVIPRRDAGESFLRASLLPLVGEKTATSGAAGQLSSLALLVSIEGNGWPSPISKKAIKRMTPGELHGRGA